MNESFHRLDRDDHEPVKWHGRRRLSRAKDIEDFLRAVRTAEPCTPGDGGGPRRAAPLVSDRCRHQQDIVASVMPTWRSTGVLSVVIRARRSVPAGVGDRRSQEQAPAELGRCSGALSQRSRMASTRDIGCGSRSSPTARSWVSRAHADGRPRWSVRVVRSAPLPQGRSHQSSGTSSVLPSIRPGHLRVSGRSGRGGLGLAGRGLSFDHLDVRVALDRSGDETGRGRPNLREFSGGTPVIGGSSFESGCSPCRSRYQSEGQTCRR